MIVIKPNPVFQLLIISGPLIGFILLSSLLIELSMSGNFQTVYFFLVLVCLLLGSATYLISKAVFDSKITASKQGIGLGSKKYFSWSEISRVDATIGAGRYAGIKIYLKKNIYHDVPFWQRPLGSKELCHVEFNTGMLFTASSQEIINMLIEARQKEY